MSESTLPEKAQAPRGPWKRFLVEIYSGNGLIGSYSPEGNGLSQPGTEVYFERFFFEAVVPLIGSKNVKVRLIDCGDDAIVTVFDGIEPSSNRREGIEFVPAWFETHPLRG